MAISRRSAKLNPIIIGLIILGVAGVVGAGVWLVRGRAQSAAPDPAEARRQQLSQRVQQMIEGLDVLIISHYTEGVVEAGQVQMLNEYQAAQQNLQHLNQWFKEIQPLLEDQQATEIERELARLQELVENKRPPAEVKDQAEKLIGMLGTVVR